MSYDDILDMEQRARENLQYVEDTGIIKKIIDQINKVIRATNSDRKKIEVLEKSNEELNEKIISLEKRIELLEEKNKNWER
ncbi:hypothetical protein EII29_02445 [Leptotrichia sp. OH3620_COT-345]|uniref:hypothetical protein n=1 Tax=Leptotrichia sp. OH3620_COT-345 TaxID=2491048 RepID=UPI000F9D1538|nr:hypothetical protein [Leptotrichia sp. OH3620_COT-345]RRD40358.1 hypothetical protein EII29_02445 [Leptotrichia sp. OH3620_COT-345]